MARRSGRRPGKQDTREAILAAAGEAFAERGFDRASIRAIATSAGVDPALVHHYFGTKDKLFLATIRSPIDPRDLIPEALAGGMDGLGERLVRLFLRVWDSPAGTAGVALVRSAMGSDWGSRLFREFVVTQVLRRVLAEVDLDPREAPLRTSLVGSQLLGMAVMRYIIKLEPIASAPAEAIVAAVGPTVQRYITGDLTDAVGHLVDPGAASGAEGSV
nr:TetR family transcriptional regulator [Micromonospora sp. DSM 115978]